MNWVEDTCIVLTYQEGTITKKTFWQEARTWKSKDVGPRTASPWTLRWTRSRSMLRGKTSPENMAVWEVWTPSCPTTRIFQWWSGGDYPPINCLNTLIVNNFKFFRIGHYYFDNKPMIGMMADINVWSRSFHHCNIRLWHKADVREAFIYVLAEFVR